MPVNEPKVFSVVVTYNRPAMLLRCLSALLSQNDSKLDKILVINNASTDNTLDLLHEKGFTDSTQIEVVTLPENIGGSGGFHYGLKLANEQNADWVWIMDDDAVPEQDALSQLLHLKLEPDTIYGSVAATNAKLSWMLTSAEQDGINARHFFTLDDFHGPTNVVFLPFIGLMISKEILNTIGLPEKDYFLAADDVEYCLRARKNGNSVTAIPSSVVNHPVADIYSLPLSPSKKMWCLKIPPWKRYYDVRNRLLLSKKHYGLKFYYQTIPGSFLRFLGTLIYETNRFDQARAFFAGLLDGLFTKKGRRHHLWKL